MADKPTQPDPFAGMSGADIIAALTRSGAGGNSVAAPASQEWILMPLKEGEPPPKDAPQVETRPGYGWYRNPSFVPKTPAAPPEKKLYGSDDTGYFAITPTPDDPYAVTRVIPPHTPNADEEINKYLIREQNEALRTQRQNNEARGFGYATDDDVIKRSNEAQRLGIDQREVALKYKQFDEAQRQFDAKQKTEDAKAAQDILQSKAQVGLIGAQAGRTSAETAQIQQNLNIAGQMLPGQLAQQEATLAGTQASTGLTQAQIEKARQDLLAGRAPTVQAPPTGMAQWTRDPITGAVTQSGINPEYVPKTQAEIAARVGQIQSLMQQKQREVQAKVGTNNYTNDDALREFQTWYGQNVQPQQAALQAAQEDAQRTAAIAAAQSRQQSYQTALGAGTGEVNAFRAMQEGRVGPGFEAANQAASRGDFGALANVPGATSYQAPDITQTSRQAVLDALKYISPTAAQATGMGMPNYSAIDIPQALGATTYAPGGGSAPPLPPPGVGLPLPPPPAAPVGAGWQRADQMFGGAPPGNQMIPPGGMPAGWVDPNSPVFMGSTYSYAGR